MTPRKYQSIIMNICENGGITLDAQYLHEVESNLWIIGGATSEIHIDMDYHQKNENRFIVDELRYEIIELDKKVSLLDKRSYNTLGYFKGIELEGVYFGGWRYIKDELDLIVFEGAFGVKDTYQALSLAKRLNQKEIYHIGLKQYLSIKKLEELMGGLL